MENKKMFKKLNTLFWFIFYVLPLLVLLIVLIGNFLIYQQTGQVIDNSILNSSINEVNNIFNGFSWDFIKDVLVNLFNSLEFTTSDIIGSFVIMFFTWFIQSSFIHILIDFILWIPRFLHNLSERWS